MCGIFGVISLNQSPVDKVKAEQAAGSIAHRGPDDYGTFSSSSGSTFFVHYRLSIIGLSELGHQPMTTGDGRYTILFNGEIYNYKELSNLSPFIKGGERGGVLNTNTDTEVLLKLFAHEGENCLNKLRGMFAFVVWDEQEKTLFAARDRFGIKPLYYLHNENEFVFSSEIKAIKKYKDGKLNIDYEGIDSFLRWGSVAPPLTFYKEIKALPPGCKLKINTIAPNVEAINPGIVKWWHFKDLLSSEEGVRNGRFRYDANAKEEIRRALLDSISAHMVSDVEVGAFLSGGIDSTAIVSLMRQLGYEKIKTVSVIFPGDKLDESEYAGIAANNYRTEHIEVPLYEKDLAAELDKIFDTMDQPTIDGVNTYFVSKVAKQAGLKVVLSGLGGDELFGGYPSFNRIPKYKRIKKLPFAKTLMRFSARLLENILPAKAIEYFNNQDVINAEFKLIRGLYTDTELKSLGWHHHSDYPADGDQKNLNEYFSQMQFISYIESCFYMSNQLLRDSDIFSMVHPLELRVPFVDHKLYSKVLPYLEDGYRKNFSKKMLVDAVGDIPAKLINRSKMGFTFPFENWIKNGELKNNIYESLKELDAKLNIDHSKIDFSRIHWSRLWALYVLNKFLN
jgi:asparagine synthase (glutamine-hydrolysing)